MKGDISMFRRLLILAVLFLSLLIISACQNTGDEASVYGNGGTTLTLWHIQTGNSEEVINNAVARFEEKHEGVNVEVIKQENDPYKTKLSVAMGGGTPPDVFHSWGGGWLENFVNAGQVRELTDEIDTSNYLDAALSPLVFDDKVYGAPLGIKIVPVWYNKDIFSEYGLREPETYEELLSIIDTLKSNDITPFALANQTKWPGAFYLMYFAERIGGQDLFYEAFNRKGRDFSDEAYVEAGTKIQELVEMGAFPEGVNGMNYDTGQSKQLIYSEKAAMEIQTDSYLDNIRSEAPEFEEKLGFFAFPSIDGGEGSSNHLVGGVSPTFSVSENSEHGELATELVKELTSIETATEYSDHGGGVSGVKGVEYTDPFVKELNVLLEEAEYLQTYYDQTLPPELATSHLDTTQALFGLSMTPEEAAKEVESKAKKILE
ncbi:extracellular solute-binding protein [Bacilli bacterium]|nr:sugar ABC transporter substrate-binding protein [Bacilli bacterium]PZD90199.1 sugar ABC transporter substrate-binding protein [Bacilli bacterium]PZD92093.1 sugar ABC transporter substrate-binding protein [Bacilli bacterium]RCO06977.1 extracellular solute-binding protein [Bacilli bacterium]RCO08125.1 extracellular solute-binding protein [Bacilli bacterium]